MATIRCACAHAFEVAPSKTAAFVACPSCRRLIMAPREGPAVAGHSNRPEWVDDDWVEIVPDLIQEPGLKWPAAAASNSASKKTSSSCPQHSHAEQPLSGRDSGPPVEAQDTLDELIEIPLLDLLVEEASRPAAPVEPASSPLENPSPCPLPQREEKKQKPLFHARPSEPAPVEESFAEANEVAGEVLEASEREEPPLVTGPATESSASMQDTVTILPPRQPGKGSSWEPAVAEEVPEYEPPEDGAWPVLDLTALPESVFGRRSRMIARHELPAWLFKGYLLLSIDRTAMRLWPHRSYTVGQHPGSDIVVPDTEYPDRSAVLKFDETAFRIEPATRRPAFRLNGQLGCAKALKNLDRLTFGSRRFWFVEGEEEWLQQFRADNGPGTAMECGAMRVSREDLSESVIAGNLQAVGLAEVLQFVSNTRKSGGLRIVSHEREGAIRFVNGSVTHAHWGLRSGPEAVYEMLRLEEGLFQFERMGEHQIGRASCRERV